MRYLAVLAMLLLVACAAPTPTATPTVAAPTPTPTLEPTATPVPPTPTPEPTPTPTPEPTPTPTPIPLHLTSRAGAPVVGLSPKPGTAIRAVASGTIFITEHTDEDPPYFTLGLQTFEGLIRYDLTGQPLVEEGAQVKAGDRIFQVGEAEVNWITDDGRYFRVLVENQEFVSPYGTNPIPLTPEMLMWLSLGG